MSYYTTVYTTLSVYDTFTLRMTPHICTSYTMVSHFVHHVYDFRKNIKSNELYYSSMLRIRSLDHFIIYLLIFFMTLSNYKQIALFILLKFGANIIRQIVKDQDVILFFIFFVYFCVSYVSLVTISIV